MDEEPLNEERCSVVGEELAHMSSDFEAAEIPKNPNTTALLVP
jgi:hypothetical protein